jgi:hypothetical protein
MSRRFFLDKPEAGRWHNLPYGMWTCADGREVLFNRSYKPIWQRRPDQLAERADLNEWVKEIKKQEWFYDDITPEGRKKALATAALVKFIGFEMTKSADGAKTYRATEARPHWSPEREIRMMRS